MATNGAWVMTIMKIIAGISGARRSHRVRRSFWLSERSLGPDRRRVAVAAGAWLIVL